jgi:UDP-N-acetylglucosamine 2-epimerase (non-hydrolysing)
MIAFVYGTTGELIKLAPVLRRLKNRDVAVLGLCTGQQAEQIPPMLADFGLPEPDLWLARGARGFDLERPLQIPGWFGRVGLSFARSRRGIARRLREADARPLLIVHGDTFTTIIGAGLGRLLGVPVAHIEAGMRSGDWRNPFPEELNRRATAKLARIHFAPGVRAVQNLRAEQVRGEVIDTGRNTISDNLRDLPAAVAPDIDVPPEPFGLVSLHRFELLRNRDALSSILTVLREAAAHRAPLLFVDHPITAAAVESAGLGHLFDSERFVRIPRQRYFRFLSLLKVSSFLVTDSGGSQEECAFMGHPCLVHRAVTEHETGLDGSVVLSRMNQETVRAFLSDPERFRCAPPPSAESPSEQIVRYLEERGFLPAAGGHQRRGDERTEASVPSSRTTRE